MQINSIAVFCGSSSGFEIIYERHAQLLGEKLVAQKIELIYGGADVGLMGELATSVVNNGGKVIGVLPHFLKDKEIAHRRLTELIYVDTMHQRKLMMNELSDGIIALPGGFGTLDELFEMLTWAQLGLHQKPIAILNIDGFFDDLLLFIDTMIRKGFLKQINKELLLVANDIDTLFEKLWNYQVPKTDKWIKKGDV